MTNYFNFGDLKSLLLGIIGGLLVLGIQRYWSNRSMKSLKRRIEEKEAYKARLDNLARSDRALLITGVQAVLAVLACICGIVVIQFLLLLRHIEFLNTLVFVLLWLLPILLCMGIVKMLEDIQNHPQSLERIEKKTTKLKNKLLGQNK
jgi:hypothetical protein